MTIQRTPIASRRRALLSVGALSVLIGWLVLSHSLPSAAAQTPESAANGAGKSESTTRPGGGDARRRGRFGEPGSPFDVIDRTGVREELKLTEEQLKKIDELAREFDKRRQEAGAAFQGLTAPEDWQKAANAIREKFDALRTEAEALVRTVLNEQQYERYRQIALQQLGVSAVRRKDTADLLKLTDAQRADVEKASADAESRMRALGFGGGREARQKIMDERDAAFMALLTAEQKTAWQAALGTPFAPTSAAPAATSQSTEAPSSKPAAAAVSSKGEERNLSFNYRFAPWEMVLRRIAEEAGLTLDMNETPPGTLNHYVSDRYTPSEAIDVLNGYLLRRGYLLVRRDQFLVVVNLDNGIPPNLVPQVPVAELPKRGRNELLSVVFPLTDADAKTAAEDVKELLGPQGKVVPLTKVNRLLVTDIGANLQRIHDLLTGLGVVEDAKGTGFRSFKLVHVTAVDAERMIRDLFGLASRGSAARIAAAAATARPSDGRQDRDRGRWGGGDWRGGGGGDWRRGGDWGGGREGRGGGDNPSSTPAAPAAPVASTQKVQMTVDTRTNTLLVTASGEDLHLIEQAIKTIDVPEAASTAQTSFSRRSNQPQMEVYAVENADIQVVIDMIDATVPGLTLRADPKTRRINVYAPPDEQEQVRNIVKQLDGGAGESVTVIQLHKLEPLAAATSLRSLFSNNRTEAPNIEADSQGRRLMVRGSPEQVAQIRKLLADLGEEGEGMNLAARSNGGPIRTIVPGGRSADELVELVQRLMPQSEGSFIRVVPPSSIATPTIRRREIDSPTGRRDGQFRRIPGPSATDDDSDTPADRDRTRRTNPLQRTEKSAPSEVERLSRDLEAALDDLANTAETEESATDAASVKSRSDANDSDNDESETSTAETDSTSSTEVDASGEEVRITSYDGKVIIASENLKALDQLEQLLQTLSQAASRKTRWTVYYLRSADATETATILGSLFPAGSVTPTSSSGSGFMSGFRGGLASLGSSLMDASGLGSLGQSGSLRILPETRSNALFISGPDDQVKQVLEALEVLDATQLPVSLKDRLPRRIPVEHADIDDVAAIVRDVYKEELDPPQPANQGQGGRGGGFNPFAMLMGGGTQNTKQRNVQMTIGIDRRTSTLIVSASDQLFRQIEDLVHSLDDSAQEARRTVRVESIRTGSSELVESALKPLLGKVSVSSTGRAAPPNNAPAPPSGGGGPFGSDEGARAFFQQRMMERMMQGGSSTGGGFSPFGGTRGEGGDRRSRFGGRRSGNN